MVVGARQSILFEWHVFNSIQLGFNALIQSKMLEHTPVMGTQSNYQVFCLSRTEG